MRNQTDYWEKFELDMDPTIKKLIAEAVSVIQ